MNRRYISIVLVLISLFLVLVSCGKKNSSDEISELKSQVAELQSILSNTTDTAPSTAAVTTTSASIPPTIAATEKTEIDTEAPKALAKIVPYKEPLITRTIAGGNGKINKETETPKVITVKQTTTENIMNKNGISINILKKCNNYIDGSYQKLFRIKVNNDSNIKYFVNLKKLCLNGVEVYGYFRVTVNPDSAEADYLQTLKNTLEKYEITEINEVTFLFSCTDVNGDSSQYFEYETTIKLK